MYILLEMNFASFPNEKKTLFLQWIEEGPNWTKKTQNDDDFDKMVAYWKQNWLAALVPSGYAEAIDAYNTYTKLTNMKTERPEPLMTSTFGVDLVEWASPLSVEDILQKTNKEISDYLKNYKDEEKRSYTSPVHGLGLAISKAIQSNPSKFSSDLSQFLDVPLAYQHEIVSSFLNLWKEKKEIIPSFILDYCKKLVSSEAFWSTNHKAAEYFDQLETISRIADLIVEGTKDDSHAFSPDDLPVVREIVLILLNKTPSDMKYPDDVLTGYLNSAKGRVTLALINYSLRKVRLKKSKETVKWDDEIKGEFTKRLDKNFEPSLEWSVFLGEHLPNLMYMDRAWVEENIDKIFPISNQEHWKAAMEGYLILPQVYPELYGLLKTHGHYEKAIETNFRNEIQGRLIDHICIGFLRGTEEIGDAKSLLHQLLNHWICEEVIEMISFFWMQRKYIFENENSEKSDTKRQALEHKQRIQVFSMEIYNRLRDVVNPSENDKKILSRNGLLSCFLDKIDKTTSASLELSAKFVNATDSIFFIEYLDRLVDPSPAEVGAIFLVLSTHLVSYTREKGIRPIVSKLYANGQKELADKICNTYFMKGIEFLRDIYEANKQPQNV
jgi:hypothetical protein